MFCGYLNGGDYNANDTTYRLLFDEPCEGILLLSDCTQVPLFFDGAAVVHEVDSDISIGMRTSVDFNTSDESRIGLVHYNISRLQLF